MSLTVYNGSPRGEKSNSKVISSWFIGDEKDVSYKYLNKVNQYNTYLEEAKKEGKILFVFPLYVDGMPGQVKEFFETMMDHKEKFKNVDVTYIIHSGFSEGIHTKHLANYLKRFSSILGMNHCGVITIPGSEGFRLMPPKMTEKKSVQVAGFGKQFMAGQRYSQEALLKLQGPLVDTRFKIGLMKLINKVGLTNIHWNNQLKKNNAYENRYDAPYKK